MAKKKKRRFLGVGIGVIAAIALLAFAFVGLPALAVSDSGDGVGIEGNVGGREGEVTVAASAVTNSINYQGRLTDSAGNPLTGTYSMTFKLYEGGTALYTDTHTVEVTDGLFNTNINFDPIYFDGRELWLGIAVGKDAEMTPRQQLRPVPYALSLRPGAKIVGSAPVALYAESTHSSGKGISGYATATSWANYGVYGEHSDSGNYGSIGGGSEGVYGYSNSGTGVKGLTNSGTGVYGRSCTSGSGDNYGYLGTTSYGVYGYCSGNRVGVRARSCRGNPIEAYGEDDSDREFYVSNDGDVYADGSFHSGGADVAEYFHAPEDPEPGTVMVIDPSGGSKLRSATNAYDTTVAGIVSTSPGVSLGTKEDGNDGEKLIAVAGRVPCKVDASYAPITPGDLLTTSDTPGHAMKAQPVVIGGVEIYRPGTTLGKALEPFDSGTGVIEVLVTLQ